MAPWRVSGPPRAFGNATPSVPSVQRMGERLSLTMKYEFGRSALWAERRLGCSERISGYVCIGLRLNLLRSKAQPA